MGLCPTMEPSTPFVQRPSFACRINQLPARKNWPWLNGGYGPRPVKRNLHQREAILARQIDGGTRNPGGEKVVDAWG